MIKIFNLDLLVKLYIPLIIFFFLTWDFKKNTLNPITAFCYFVLSGFVYVVINEYGGTEENTALAFMYIIMLFILFLNFMGKLERKYRTEFIEVFIKQKPTISSHKNNEKYLKTFKVRLYGDELIEFETLLGCAYDSLMFYDTHLTSDDREYIIPHYHYYFNINLIQMDLNFETKKIIKIYNLITSELTDINIIGIRSITKFDLD